MRRMSDLGSVRYMLIISVLFLSSIVGCSQGNDLSRSMAKDLILSNSEYPKEITMKILVEYSTQAPSLPIETYANELKRLGGLANAEISKQQDSFAGLLTHTTIKVTLTDKGKKYIRGETESGGSRTWLPVLLYTASFGEVTGLMFMNEEKTSAVAEYTELNEPSPFALIEEILYQGAYKQPETVNKKAYFQMYDDGWRVVRVD